VNERHFTYSDNLDAEALKQGDILEKTPELSALLNNYHSYYATSSEYTHFQVLTRSCDLVRRGSNNNCTSRYITLAAVRSLDTVIKRAITHFADKRVVIDNEIYCSENIKANLVLKLRLFLTKTTKNISF